MKKKLHFSHGEVSIFEVDALPDRVVRKEPENNVYRLADSEVTGNHHILESCEGVEVYEKNGTLYIKNSSPAKVTCVLKERHDTIELPPNKIWEVEPAREYDYLNEEIRKVAD